MTLIWLPGYKPASQENVKKIMGWSQRLDRYRASLPPQLCLRDDPYLPEHKGPIDIDSAPVQAVIQTLANHDGDSRVDYMEPYHFFNPPTLGLKSTPFSERLAVTAKLYREFEHCLKPDNRGDVRGDVFDPYSPFIANNGTTPFYWMEHSARHSNVRKWEVLFDTQRPCTKFACDANLDELREKHEKQNIFANGPLEFIVDIGYGWHLPIIGVTELTYSNWLDDNRNNITLSNAGTKETPYSQDDRHYFVKSEGFFRMLTKEGKSIWG
jgi:hypothetical protein